MTMQAVTHAAVAVLVQADGQVLMGRRPEGKAWAGWWEFPGGKVEKGEVPYDALVRELHEELGIQVVTAYPWLTRQFDYPEKTVKLHFFMVRAWQGEPYGKEGQQLLWQHPHAVSVAPVLPANAPIIKALQLPSLYATTHFTAQGEAVFFERLSTSLNNGLGLIQIDEPQLDAPTLELFASKVISLAHTYGTKVLIHGDIALALKLAADGVHLRADQLMALTARPALAWSATTCHNTTELAHASQLGVDFAVVSPSVASQFQPNAQVLDWDAFAQVVEGNVIPVFASGGLKIKNLEHAWQLGAHGIAITTEDL